MNDSTVARRSHKDAPPKTTGLVVGYLSGPTNGRQIVEAWRTGQELGYFGTVYMAQLCDVVRKRGAEGVIVTYSTDPPSVECIDEFTIYNIQRRARQGLRYHLEILRRMLVSFRIMHRHGANVVVLTEAMDYWFTTIWLRFCGIKIVPSLHCSIWTPFKGLKLTHAFLRWLNKHLFYRRQRTPLMGVSELIGRQVKELTDGRSEFFRFFSTYSPKTFEEITPMPTANDFTVLFIGRMDESKGIFDLLDAVGIARESEPTIRLHFCGGGSMLDEMRGRCADDPRTLVHGDCDRLQLKRLLSESHVVVAPTRTDFEEGFAKVCAEAVLAGRPVITSAVCPAIEDIKPAAIEVAPNDVAGYAEAIWRLASDPTLYARMRKATEALKFKFYDLEKSYGHTLERILDIILSEKA